MKSRIRTLEEVRQVGLAALTEVLGHADAIRFLQLFTNASGDYTAERRKTLGDPTIDEIVRELSKRKSKSRKGKPSQ